MDSSANALLALSNTAIAIADENENPHDDDDRSSSLSELEDAPDNVELEEDGEEEEEEEPVTEDQAMMDADSEAETERLENSPDKVKRGAFQISPSKLAQSMNASDDVRPEIEELTNSEASSPMTPVGDSPIDDLSEAEELDETENPLNILSQAVAVSNKRKRLSDVMGITNEERPRKRRTDSLSEPDDDEEESDPESEIEIEIEKAEVVTRESTIEPAEAEAPAESDNEKEEKPEPGQDQAESSEDSKTKKPEQRRSRRGKGVEEPDEDEHAVEASEDEVEGEEGEPVAKTEEEQAKRMSAMEALIALEKHFASLRDKLYDDKLAQFNRELQQLSATKTDHPQLLKQFACVDKYRDEKQDVEQKLLVFKVGALKRKSVAERSQILSGYFQTVRDIGERHMERMSEQFYRIQRERFKPEEDARYYNAKEYIVPFPEKQKRNKHQHKINQEVSVLSGVAKYRGFPAAPDFSGLAVHEQEEDLRHWKSRQTVVADIIEAASARKPSTAYNVALKSSRPAYAETIAATIASEQAFLNDTPWANPKHPSHSLGGGSLKPNTTTPAGQRNRYENTPQPMGSASTIVEHPSAQPTPGTDLASSSVKLDSQTNGMISMNGDSISPSETRRTINNMLSAGAVAQQQTQTVVERDSMPAYLGVNSSPLLARAGLLSSLNRTASATGMRESTKSPFRQDFVPTGGGMGRFGFR